MNKVDFTKALITMQGELPTIPRGRTAKVPTKSGGQYSYSYADLSDVVYACMPVLHKHGFALVQVGVVLEGKQALRTVLMHYTGHELSSDFILPATDDPQDAGASITYFRRYAECAILGIVTEDDSDAATVGANKNPPKSGPVPLKAVSSGPETLGDYQIQIGKKFLGKKLKDCGPFNTTDGVPEDLLSYANWLRAKAAEKKMNLAGIDLETVEKIEAFVEECKRKKAQ